MIDFATLSPFGWVVLVCVFIMRGAAWCGVLLALRTRDELTRAVMSDIVFYGMICMYLGWSMINNAPLAYDIALIGAIAAGILPTLSMARIISKGRR